MSHFTGPPRRQPDAAAIADYVAVHGVRRFGMGESAAPIQVTAYLTERGYSLTATPHGTVRLRRPGRRKVESMGWVRLIAEVDQLRMAEGLEPIRPPGTPVPEPHADRKRPRLGAEI